ncbi:phage adaptor protein [Pseudomonas multiresinivorans]|uniref:Uncharacterized protein n=1 Tax=Pseudomonas multiresinivorans TaxID=95301 RepID=A0A7Z3BP67_9PSED|nr:hypothetical protein [Pseudomonas multiresinivorans]QJP10457.1 hypothetical protein G4G71_22155 [Pseudomonas multiresinivorans]
MSISNYAELQAAVADWLNRNDLTARVTDFIRMGEDQLSLDLKARQMESQVILNTTAGVANVALPTDMHELRRFRVNVPYSQPLAYRTPDEISADYSSSASGQPIVYTIIGFNAELAPIPDAAYQLLLTYQQQLPPLSDLAPVNWLITDFPSAYLYASLLAAEPFLKNDDRIPTWQAMYQKIVDSINGSDWAVASTLRVRAR